MTFGELEKEIRNAPMTWTPALLKAAVETAQAKGAFLGDVGIRRFVANVLHKANTALVPAKIENGRCACDYPRRCEEIGEWDGCPLEGGGHTSFQLNRCVKCGKVFGFPDSNLDIALENGTPATKQKLAQIMNPNP